DGERRASSSLCHVERSETSLAGHGERSALDGKKVGIGVHRMARFLAALEMTKGDYRAVG
ncbi:MAG: hypothetical protein ACP5M0_16145, partial [Desulfomonilaceae bacterium]